jgi:hypothetical protein
MSNDSKKNSHHGSTKKRKHEKGKRLESYEARKLEG